MSQSSVADPEHPKSSSPRYPVRTQQAGVSQRREARVDELLSTAVRVFAERGYRQTNLKYIGEVHGVSRQALYHYFPRKQDILLKIIRNFNEHLLASILEGTSCPDPAVRFRTMLRLHFAAIGAAPDLSRVVLENSNEFPPEALDYGANWRRRYQKLFSKAYDEAAANGTFKPIKGTIVASLVLGAGNSLFRWYRPDGPMSPAEMAILAEGLLVDGLTCSGTEHGEYRPN